MFQSLVRAIGELFNWFVIVAPWEQAIRVRCGKHVTLLRSGFHLRAPVIDRIYRQPIRRRLCLVKHQTLTTQCGQTITVSGQLGYIVKDLLKLYQTLHDAQDTIVAEVCALVSEYVATNDVDLCTPNQIERYVRAHLDIDRYGLGDPEFYLVNYARVRTYRLIMGELASWQYGDALSTSQSDKIIPVG